MLLLSYNTGPLVSGNVVTFHTYNFVYAQNNTHKNSLTYCTLTKMRNVSVKCSTLGL